MKQTARIENWYEFEGFNGSYLVGIVQDHPRAELNGQECRTSRLVSLNREAKTAETLNTIYTLGTELESGKGVDSEPKGDQN